METKILLNDLLQLKNLENVKVRLNKDNGLGDDPIGYYKESSDKLLRGQFYNFSKSKSFREGNIAIGLARIEGDKWLLFNIAKITKDLEKLNAVGYEYETLSQFEKYFGRLIVKYHNKSQNMIRLGENIMKELEVIEILPEHFNDDDFPGYENVNLSWDDLERVATRKDWKTALENQKGVYLISDLNTGKLYVGSASGKKMILGRWRSYLHNGHGGNAELKKIVSEKGFDYIKKNFKYSILDIYKSTTEGSIIKDRESRWKEVLLSKKFGYNLN